MRYFYEIYAGSAENSHREILASDEIVSTIEMRARTVLAFIDAANTRRAEDVAYWTPLVGDRTDIPMSAHARSVVSGSGIDIRVEQVFDDAIRILCERHEMQTLPCVRSVRLCAWDTIWPKPEAFAGGHDWTEATP